MGTEEQWEIATQGLIDALKATDTKYRVNEGDGAFYGPKIDFHIKDCLGRTWQCATCQLDFQMPERFDMNYIAADNEEHRPIMIHRTIFGSLERFFGILIEHFAGAFPTWLAPTQVMTLPIADRHIPEVAKVKQQLEEAGLRVEIDGRSKKVNYKIREAQLKKIPYMIIMGDNEIEQGKVSLRLRNGKEIQGLEVEKFIEMVKGEVASYSLTSVFEDYEG
jgi:threonyl-tRNA synthetase